MKKGLLSILAGALVVVGCQNYDDQFDNLESQISALASTVAGLSQVQSDLASLAGTVNSLSSSVASLGSQIDTAVADGLSDIQEDIDAIEAAVADVASSEEVSALQDAVDASQEDLDELLANSSVFTGAVTVNSVATLDAFHQMKGSLGIVNGDVTITVSEEMDQTKVQELVDAMLTIIGDLTYTSNSSSIAETTFNNLTGVTSITATQGGGYQFAALTSAGTINLFDNYESTVTKIDFRELTSVDNFFTDTTEDIIEFTKATELHLTKLGRYSTTSAKPLKLIIDEGGALPLAIDDVATDGDQEDLYLEITGPDAITFDNIEDGQLTFTDVKTVTVNGFLGTIVTNDGVESLTADTVVNAPTLGADLENITLTGVADADDSDDTHGPSITISNQDNLETLTLAGKLGAITLDGNDNLTDVTISADVDGAISIGATTNNSDLVNVTLTGSKATGVTVSNNAEIETLTIDTTMQAGTATDAVLDGSVVVSNNDALTSLTISSSNLETLTITGNDDLTTIEGSGITAIGATGEPTVTIEDNDLTATASVDAEDTTATDDGAASTDLGSISTDSGMDTLKTYLALVAADADSTAEVYFDTVESYTNESDTEVTDQVWVDGAVPTANKVLVLTPAVVNEGDDAYPHKVTFVLDANSTQEFGVAINGLQIFDANRDDVEADGDYQFTGNQTLDLAAIGAAAHVTRAAAENVTLSVAAGGDSSVTVSLTGLKSTTSTATLVGERYGNLASLDTAVDAIIAAGTSSSVLGSTDYITLTVGSNSATATGADAQALATNLLTAWTAKYSTGGTHSKSTNFTISNSAGVLTIDGVREGSTTHNVSVSIAVTAGETSETSAKALDWMIGSTTAAGDNATDSDNVMLTLLATQSLPQVDPLRGGSLVISDSESVSVELTSTLRNNSNPAAEVTGYLAVFEDRADAQYPEAGSADIVASAAVSFSRVHWLD
jgi:PBP1b-binding outer membrane lipoprotein LpoB